MLAYTVEGMPKDVQAELDQVRQAVRKYGTPEPMEVEAPTGTNIWTNILSQTAHKALLVRIGIPDRNLSAYIQEQIDLLTAGSFIVDISNGLLYTMKEFGETVDAISWLEALRKPALVTGGYAVVIDMPAFLQGKIDRWGYQPEGLHLMRALKAHWDPQYILNPGIFVDDI